jgi:hypothetical protein
MSTDIPRYLPLIWVLGVASLVGATAGLIALFAAVPPDHRGGFFWIVFGDLAEGLAQAILLVFLLLRLPRARRQYSPAQTIKKNVPP